jgi:hypothetical protein
MLAKDALIPRVQTTYMATPILQKIDYSAFAPNAGLERPGVSEAGGSNDLDRQIRVWVYLGCSWTASVSPAHNPTSQGLSRSIVV